MKYLILSALALCCFVACKSKTKEDKMHGAIFDFMKKNINDPKAYESVDFREIRNDSSNVEDDPQYQKLKEELATAKQEESDYIRDYDYSYATYSTYLDTKLKNSKAVYNILTKQMNFLEAYKPKPIGFGMMHVYRKKNTKGATVLDSMYFKFDSTMNIRKQDYYRLINED